MMIADALTPDDIDRMAKGLKRKPRTGEERNGDLRIGEHMIKFRVEFGYPRSTVARVTGLSETSIFRLEVGQRMFSAHSLTNLIMGLKKTVHMMSPTKDRAFEKWAWELLEIVAEVEEEERVNRKLRGQRPHTTEEGRR